MANLDTALKRLSGIHPTMPWRASYPLPDGVISRADRQVVARLYSGILASSPPTTAALSGTAVAGISEADVVAGGKTIVITIAHDTWVASGATFDAQRQAILNGLDSAQSEAHGWNTEVRDAESVTAVVRTSDTIVTITLSAAAAYDITADETITVTVPSSALTNSLSAVVASPTFSVSATQAVTQRGGGTSRRLRSLPQYYSRQIYGRKIQLPEEPDAREVAEEVLDQAAGIVDDLRDGDSDYAAMLRSVDELARTVAAHIESRGIYNLIEEVRAQVQAKRDAEIKERIEAIEEEREVTEIMDVLDRL